MENGIKEFFEMGGYATFIWTSYGLSSFVLVALTYLSFRKLRKTQTELAPLEEQRLARRKEMRAKRVTS